MHIGPGIEKIRRQMMEKGISFKKKFGQNFMLNPNARQKIASLLQLSKDVEVWEVFEDWQKGEDTIYNTIQEYFFSAQNYR